MSILSKSSNCIKNAICIIMILIIIKSITIKSIRRLITFLIIIIINEKINEKIIIIIMKITKSLNLTILNSNRNLRILIYRKFIIIARK